MDNITGKLSDGMLFCSAPDNKHNKFFIARIRKTVRKHLFADIWFFILYLHTILIATIVQMMQKNRKKTFIALAPRLAVHCGHETLFPESDGCCSCSRGYWSSRRYVAYIHYASEKKHPRCNGSSDRRGKSGIRRHSRHYHSVS